MANFSRVKIYVQPHVAKYLAVNSRLIKVPKQISDQVPEDSLYFNAKNVVGKLLILSLEIADFERAYKHGRRSEPVILALTDWHRHKISMLRHPVGIDNAGCDYINHLIKELMWSQLYFKVESDRKNGVKKIDSINEFFRFYSITEDDLSFEARKKGFYRYSKLIASIENIDLNGKVHDTCP